MDAGPDENSAGLDDDTAASVWGAAWSLATFFAGEEGGALVHGRSVVELGAGTGVRASAASFLFGSAAEWSGARLGRLGSGIPRVGKVRVVVS